MYRMTNSEFMQYHSAERRLQELRKQHAYELQQAYDNIHPTRSAFDYGEGSIYSESINPAEYAIYLVELKEEHAKRENWWELRAKAFSEALGKLTDEERSCLTKYEYGKYQERQNVWNRLRELLAEIIDTRPELQRKTVSLNAIEDLEEADRQIEKMNKKELLEDYQDFIGTPEVAQKEEKTEDKIEKIPLSMHSNVNIYYLSSEELAEYRNGKKRGSKWCSYEDYKRMKNSGMTDKEIALKLRIEPSMLSKRVKAWKGYRFKHKNILV